MARPRSGFHGEADFDGHLPVIHLSLVDIAARFDHLKPAQVLDGFVRAFNGLINGVLDGSGGGAGEFDEFIDVVFHVRFFQYSRVRSLGMSAYLQPQVEQDSLTAFSTASRVSPVRF
jgi:hypothetical protein